MKDSETRHRFFELRAQGKSLRTIAAELGVGRQTLVNWGRENMEQIENLKAMELDALMERHRLTAQAQIERYGVELARVTEELQKRDLADVKTPKLYDVLIKLHARVDEVRQEFTLRDDEGRSDRLFGTEEEQVSLHARQTGDHNETTQLNIFLHPDFMKLKQIIIQTLEPFPDARLRLSDALSELASGNDEQT